MIQSSWHLRLTTILCFFLQEKTETNRKNLYKLQPQHSLTNQTLCQNTLSLFLSHLDSMCAINQGKPLPLYSKSYLPLPSERHCFSNFLCFFFCHVFFSLKWIIPILIQTHTYFSLKTIKQNSFNPISTPVFFFFLNPTHFRSLKLELLITISSFFPPILT